MTWPFSLKLPLCTWCSIDECLSVHLQALHERGEKLSELEERTAQMMANAENFSQAANQLMAKYKDKKWYQFWATHTQIS